MSNKINLPPKNENKNDFPQKIEKENRFLLDIQLLSTLKSIPGKIIPLSNKLNDVSKNNNKEINIEKNNKIETFNKIYHRSNSIFNQIDKSNINYINNNNSINNIYTTNNYFFNNNINIPNINQNYNLQGGYSPIQEHYGFFDNPLLISPSNNPSFLSIKSDMKNNNFMFTENKFTQNSYHFHNYMMFNGNYNNQNENIINKDNNINNFINNKFSQLSYQNYGNEDFLKKKRSTNILFKKNSQNFGDNNNNMNNKNNLLVYNNNNNNDISKKENKNIININEEQDKKKEGKDEIKNNDLKNKKILFNIENFSEESYVEENAHIYHNTNNNNKLNNNIFNCYHKKKKRRRKNNEIKKYKCVHPKCDNSYKTLKQLQNHHYKMISECQLDSVQILKLIYNIKKILFNLVKKNKKKQDYFSDLYEESINKITLNNYSEFITGIHFNDKI